LEKKVLPGEQQILSQAPPPACCLPAEQGDCSVQQAHREEDVVLERNSGPSFEKKKWPSMPDFVETRKANEKKLLR